MRSPSTQMRPPSMVSSWLMQRRNVVLPEPDGPSRHTTSRLLTSRSMPLRTSVPWNALCTLTACTSGISPAISVASLGDSGRLRPRRLGAEPTAEASLQEVLADHHDAREDQVVDRGRDEHGERLVRAAAD